MSSPVACARPAPNAAVPPVFDRFPDTFAVIGVPEVAVKLPLSVHPVKALVFQPPFRHKPCMPTGEETM